MEQLKRQNAKKNLSRILRAENTLLDPEKKKQKEMMNTPKLEKSKKEKIALLKIKKIFLD